MFTARPFPRVLHGAALCSIMGEDMASKNRVTVNLSDDEAAQLAELADRERVSKAWLGRRAICDLLDRTRTQDQDKPLSIISGGRGKR